MARPALRPETLAPYFLLVALIHAFAVATRFDAFAERLPDVVAPALMIVQFPLIVLSGYFESRLDYGETLKELPLWMRIRSKPVKLAFTFAFIYVVLVPLQTWDVSIGPLDPTPPTSFPLQQRVMWFAMFTGGMFFPFYLGATGILVPVLRVITWPLRQLAPILAAIGALVVGAAIGMVILALSTSSDLGAFIKTVKDAYKANPAIGMAVTFATTFGPGLIGLVRGKKEP